MPVSQKPLVIIGAGGHAASVADAALSAGFKLACFVAPDSAGEMLLGLPVVADMPDASIHDFCIAIGDNAAREKIAAQNAQMNYPPVIHKAACVSPFATIGAGSVVLAQAVVGPNSTLGRFCVVNTHASLDHDNALADYASLGPRAVTGGNVKIGVRTAIGIGAVVRHGIVIGADSVLGAASYLDKNLPDNLTAYGTPAKPVRSRAKGDRYL